MKTLKFEGCSDDTFGEYGVTGEDVDNCASNAPIQGIITSLEGNLIVVGHYYLHPLHEGCWTIGISNYKDGEDIPNWPIRMSTSDSRYSPILEIDVPDDFKLTWFSDCRKIISE